MMFELIIAMILLGGLIVITTWIQIYREKEEDRLEEQREKALIDEFKRLGIR